MSYDYNAILSKIQKHRKAQEWEESVETFGTLSTQCPMTPLLWLQYAHDTSKLFITEDDNQDSLKVRLDTLELGISEFPGCALLQLYYVENLVQSTDFNTSEKIEEGIQNALQTVGRGSHCNEDILVVQIYRHYVQFKLRDRNLKSNKDVINIFLQRAISPMKKGNEVLQDEFENLLKTNNITVISKDMESFENGRRQAGICYGMLKSFEDDVDEAMETEGILSRYKLDLNDTIDWDMLISPMNNINYWMGLGSTQTAQSFIKYAKACSRLSKETDSLGKQNLNIIKSLTFLIYERGISECPTVEHLWKAYLLDLSWIVNHGHANLASTLKTAASRAVLNCPYSLWLAQFQMETFLILANLGNSVLDPDSLTAMIGKTIKAKFLTSPIHHLELYLTAIRIMKRRILYLIVMEYDEVFHEKSEQKNSIKPLSDAAEEEIQDLAEDLREVYDEADKFLAKHHKKCSESRFALLNERCKTENAMLTPLLQALENSSATQSASPEPMRCFEQLVELHPHHPNSYRGYIQVLMSKSSVSVQEVALKFQKIRFQYHKALKTISQKPDPLLDNSKQILCQEFTEFEQLFGSEKSKRVASNLVKSQFSDRRRQNNEQVTSGLNSTESISTKKRWQNEVPEPANKKQRTLSSNESDNVSPSSEVVQKNEAPKSHVKQINSGTDTGEKEENKMMKDDVKIEKSELKKNNEIVNTKDDVPKIRIGNMEFPVHPFTIRVSNLAPEVEDMDLVDLFRPKCGAVVHARIIREKQRHQKGKSKGWGLVQFEEQDSVKEALALNDVISLQNQNLRIEKSHLAAASLVPQGMHRIKSKGEGKFSKRNQKKKEQWTKEKVGIQETGITETNTVSSKKKEDPPSTSILAFQPRGLSRKKNQSVDLK